MTTLNVHKILTRLAGPLRHCAFCAVAAALCAGLVACDDKNEPSSSPSVPQLPQGRTFLSVLVSTDDDAGSRADWEGPTWGNDYNQLTGEDFENKINDQRVHVALLSSDGSVIAHNENNIPLGNYYTGDEDSDIMILPLPGQTNKFYLYFDVTDLRLQKGQQYLLAVTANYSNADVPSISSISDTTFDLSYLMNHTEGETIDPENYYKGYIPMFGLLRFTFGEYDRPETYFDMSTIGTVSLLRSVCKIEVRLPQRDQSTIADRIEFDENTPPHLAYVSGTHLNKTGYITPDQDKWLLPSVYSIKDLTFSGSFNELKKRWSAPAEQKDKHYYLPAIKRDENGKIIAYYIYLPEASGLSMEPNPDALRLNIAVKYHPEDETLPVRTINGTVFPSIYYDEENQRYPSYVNYKRWKLIRNHIYRYVITGVADETALEYRVSATGSQTIDVPNFE